MNNYGGKRAEGLFFCIYIMNRENRFPNRFSTAINSSFCPFLLYNFPIIHYSLFIIHFFSIPYIYYHRGCPHKGLYNKTFLCYNSRGNKNPYDFT